MRTVALIGTLATLAGFGGGYIAHDVTHHGRTVTVQHKSAPSRGITW